MHCSMNGSSTSNVTADSLLHMSIKQYAFEPPTQSASSQQGVRRGSGMRLHVAGIPLFHRALETPECSMTLNTFVRNPSLSLTIYVLLASVSPLCLHSCINTFFMFPFPLPPLPLSLALAFHLSTHLALPLSLGVSVPLSLCPLVSLSPCPSVSLSLLFSVSPSLCRSVSPSLCLCASVSPSSASPSFPHNAGPQLRRVPAHQSSVLL